MRKLTAIFIFLPFAQVNGQPADTLLNDGHFLQDSLVSIFYSRQDSLTLYNGRQFYGYSLSIEGSAFYQSTEWKTGSVFYDGNLYHNVEMMYDLYRDELIVKHPVGIPLLLFRERVKEFTLAGQTFEYLESDPTHVISNGFYHRIAKGRAVVYVKRKKNLEEKINGLQVDRKFVSSDHFYVMIDGKYHPVKKQQELLSLFKDKRAEIYQFKDRMNMKYKTNPEQFILTLVNYYNQLHPEHEK